MRPSAKIESLKHWIDEKIQGSFEAGQQHGLSGRQGVIIRARNINNLGLRRDVIEAVENGCFSVYGVSTANEAGLDTGERSSEGMYPERTVYANVSRRLSEMARMVMDRRGGGQIEATDRP